MISRWCDSGDNQADFRLRQQAGGAAGDCWRMQRTTGTFFTKTLDRTCVVSIIAARVFLSVLLFFETVCMTFRAIHCWYLQKMHYLSALFALWMRGYRIIPSPEVRAILLF